MNRIILITGRNASGKTTKAKEIASKFLKEEVVFISYRGEKTFEDNFLFSECTENTKLVVFEELYNLMQVELFLKVLSSPITVNKKMKAPFTISPQFVLVCQIEITDEQIAKLSERFFSRFNVIKCKRELTF